MKTIRTPYLQDVVTIIDNDDITSIVVHGKVYDKLRFGKWIEDGSAIRCSECGYAPILKIFFCDEKIWELPLEEEFHYCPHCGARVELKEVNDEL